MTSAAPATPSGSSEFRPGDLVRARGREWVVLPETGQDLLRLRPLGGAEDDSTLIFLPLEPEKPRTARFDPPDPENPGSQEAALLLRDALRLKLRAGAGPFRSFGNLNFEPRAYQLVPLLMALKQETIRILIADDVGIGKTIEAGLIAREMLDRGEIKRLTVICPPHLCEQWKQELNDKFGLESEIVRTGTATRLERGLRPDESVFERYPFTVVSLDYIKSDRRRSDFMRACPEFVIVDEAHTCARSNTGTRHQRYALLNGLASGEPRRHMVFLTATPHSGDDAAFHNLLGFLDRKFVELGAMPEGPERDARRRELANYFVQRRRGDIKEWRDQATFPARERREDTYRLTGAWGELFADILDYARGMVKKAEGGSLLEQRMSWWAALALLRCASSSPEAATAALRTRLQRAGVLSEEDEARELDKEGLDSVLDGSSEEALSQRETVPAGTVESSEEVQLLRDLIDRASELRSVKNDPKLRTVIKAVKGLVRDRFKPVVFCRFIATARYVGNELASTLPSRGTKVLIVTGELTPEQRKERIDELATLEERVTPVLVATDCLSEGINLQSHFDAVIHYDLTWNPTRHEQREGRVDRFGQASKAVRSLMLYGENNPVDGAVLKVILRKAERIKTELGVAVPIPADDSKVIETIMKAVLLSSSESMKEKLQLGLDIDIEGIEAEIEPDWNLEKLLQSRTVFAQQRLRPDDVLPEWTKAVSALGGPEDVARFVRRAATRLGAPLEEMEQWCRLPVSHLPPTLQDRLESVGVKDSTRVSFKMPAPDGAEYIHRAHPLVSILADHISEDALDTVGSGLGARCGAVFTTAVQEQAFLYVLRLRHRLQVEQRMENGDSKTTKAMLAEECVAVAIRADRTPEPIKDEEAFSMLSLEPAANMPTGLKTRLIRRAIDRAEIRRSVFEGLAKSRADRLLEDHRRIRDASGTKGQYFQVRPALPVDLIGVYVFQPHKPM